MKKMNLRELQMCELQILLFFDEFCRKNGIRYSLASGTMIGAVRHQGFIPWDDDIDIFMRRAEFEKSRHCAAKQGYSAGRYRFCFPGSEGYFYPFLKITDTKTAAQEKIIRPEYTGGVWIDVFPIDYCADTKEEARRVCAVHEKYTEDYFRYFVRCDVNDLRSFVKKSIFTYIRLCFVEIAENFCKN